MKTAMQQPRISIRGVFDSGASTGRRAAADGWLKARIDETAVFPFPGPGELGPGYCAGMRFILGLRAECKC